MEPLLIFEVSGVLNRTGTRNRNPRDGWGIEPCFVKRLRHIVRGTKCKLLCWTDWVTDGVLVEYLHAYLGPDLIKQTIAPGDNGEGNHPIVYLGTHLPECWRGRATFIQTSINDGLTPKIMEAIMETLKGKSNAD